MHTRSDPRHYHLILKLNLDLNLNLDLELDLDLHRPRLLPHLPASLAITYHGHFIDEPTNLFEVAQPALLGLPSAAFDGDAMNLRVRRARSPGTDPELASSPPPPRHPLLSFGATRGILQSVADAGSYYARLKYTVAQLDKLSTSSLHVALAAELHRQLYVQPPAACREPLRFAREVHIFRQHLYVLCRVMGCQNLSAPIGLTELPPAVALLSHVYEVCEAHFQPKLRGVTWSLLVAILNPWLTQLDRMLGPQLAARLVWQYPEVYVAEMFVERGEARFVLDESKVPVFMPRNLAQLAVEALNCRLVLPPGGSPEWGSEGPRGTRGAVGAPKIWADKTSKKYSPPQIFYPMSPQPPTSVPWAVAQMVRPIYELHAELNVRALRVLQELLPHEIKVLREVCLLENGVLWLMLRQELREGRPCDAQLARINACIESFGLNSIEIVHRLELPAETHVDFEYRPPRELASVLSAPLVRTLRRVFARLLAMQQTYSDLNDPAPLAAFTLRLGAAAAKLRVEGTLEQTVRTFERFATSLDSLIA